MSRIAEVPVPNLPARPGVLAGMKEAVNRIGLHGLLALCLPVAGLAVVVARTLLIALGPDVVACNWAGLLLLNLVVLVGYGLVVFSSLRYWSSVVCFGSFLLLGFGTVAIERSVEERILAERGEVTACTVRDVERRVERYTDGDGHTSTDVHYDYRVACRDPQVHELTTDRKVADEGERLDVRHDPAGRLDPRPAEFADALLSSQSFGALLFASGMVLRLLVEANVRLFGLLTW